MMTPKSGVPTLANSNTPLLEVQGLSSRLEDKTVLREVSLCVNRSETVSVLGPNGAGKTSLLRTISGVLPAIAGRILFEGQDITNRKPWDIARSGIAHVPQGRRCFKALSIVDNLKMGGYVDPKRIPSRIEEIFALFPVLAEKAGHPASSLSGGQQQMLAIGRGLMSGPKLLLLDEPSLGLSPLFVNEVMATLAKLCASNAVTIMLVEQNLRMVRGAGGRFYVLRNGEMAIPGEDAAGLTEDRIAEIYLGKDA